MVRRVTLLYNPVAGRHPQQRITTINRVATALTNAGLLVEVISTRAPGSAAEQAAEACSREADIVFACGGDGTIHEVLQGMVHQQKAVLGVLPLGSANALARHLRLALDPLQAALQQIERKPSLVPVGRVSYQTPAGERSRYFTVMAGAGPDGALVYKMLAGGKQQLGRAAYYLRAIELFLRSRFAPFSLTYTSSDSIASLRVVSVMAVRVGDLGGPFKPLVRGASVDHQELQLVAATTPARVSLPAWFAMSWSGLGQWNPYMRMTQVESFHCGAGEGAPVQVQADGEWLGRTPMSVTIVPDALRLLLPESGLQ